MSYILFTRIRGMLDELLMDTDKLKTQVNELSRNIDDMTRRVITLASLFTNYYIANDKRFLLLEKRISRLENK